MNVTFPWRLVMEAYDTEIHLRAGIANVEIAPFAKAARVRTTRPRSAHGCASHDDERSTAVPRSPRATSVRSRALGVGAELSSFVGRRTFGSLGTERNARSRCPRAPGVSSRTGALEHWPRTRITRTPLDRAQMATAERRIAGQRHIDERFNERRKIATVWQG